MAQDRSGVYARQATGLVREGSPWSVLVYNINFISIGLMLMFVLQLIPSFYPGGDMVGSFLLALLIVLPTSLVFSMLAAAMPRSGADYVYVSRILGPRLGMISSWINTVWWFIYGGVPSAFFARFGRDGIGAVSSRRRRRRLAVKRFGFERLDLGAEDEILALHHRVHDGADLILCLGARFDDRVTGRLDAFSPNSKKIHIDIDLHHLDHRHIVTGVGGDDDEVANLD